MTTPPRRQRRHCPGPMPSIARRRRRRFLWWRQSRRRWSPRPDLPPGIAPPARAPAPASAPCARARMLATISMHELPRARSRMGGSCLQFGASARRYGSSCLNSSPPSLFGSGHARSSHVCRFLLNFQPLSASRSAHRWRYWTAISPGALSASGATASAAARRRRRRAFCRAFDTIACHVDSQVAK